MCSHLLGWSSCRSLERTDNAWQMSAPQGWQENSRTAGLMDVDRTLANQRPLISATVGGTANRLERSPDTRHQARHGKTKTGTQPGTANHTMSLAKAVSYWTPFLCSALVLQECAVLMALAGTLNLEACAMEMRCNGVDGQFLPQCTQLAAARASWYEMKASMAPRPMGQQHTTVALRI